VKNALLKLLRRNMKKYDLLRCNSAW